MSQGHRVSRRDFETELMVNGRKLPLNNFVQETLANTLIGFLKTLKQVDQPPVNIEIKIKKLTQAIPVDAHKYP